jgi:excisionase family DNA binding protein
MLTDESDRQVLRPAQVARRFQVSVVTVGKWADEGLIPSFRTPGGQRRFYEDEISEYIRSQPSRAAS